MTTPETVTKPNTTNRPLSPHLTIYRWPITMTLSILHRITGGALAVGSILIVYWLWAAAYSPEAFDMLTQCAGGMLGRVVLVAWSAAFYYHLLNGIRHLFWDMGTGLEVDVAKRSAWIVLFGTVVLTVITWASVLHSMEQL